MSDLAEFITPSGTPRPIYHDLPKTDPFNDDTHDTQKVNFNRASTEFRGGFDINDPELLQKVRSSIHLYLSVQINFLKEREAYNKRNREKREREKLGLFLNRRFFSFTDDDRLQNPAISSPASPPVSPRLSLSLHEASSNTPKPKEIENGTLSAPTSPIPRSKRRSTMPNLTGFMHRGKSSTTASPIDTVEEEGETQEGRRPGGGGVSAAHRWAKLKSLIPRPGPAIPVRFPLHTD